MSELDARVRQVHSCCPAIYLACRTRHERRKSSSARLSTSDGTVLAHRDRSAPLTPSARAGHLGLEKPTVSAALKRLETLGYLRRTVRAGDARAVNLQITPADRDAVQASSVLDATRVRALLKALSTMERRQAVSGLAHLARAAGQGAAGRPT